MAYSDVVKTTLLSSIDKLAKNPEKFAVHPGKDFTRNRKLCFKDFILLLLTMEGDCIREELYRFFGRSDCAPKKSAYCNQRAKLKPESLLNLLHIFTQKFSHKLYKDKYRLVACDGSVADIFRDETDKDTYFPPNNKSPRGFNQIHINALYSVLDKKFLDVLVQPCRKRNEYQAFCQMIDRTDNTTPSIYLADRGYASYNNFAHVMANNQYFLIRCTDVKTSRLLGFSVNNVKELDFHVDRILTRSNSKKKRLHPERSMDYRYICQEVPFDYLNSECTEYHMSLRIVRIEISENTYENLITNLPDVEFDIEELKELYHKRWDQETAYRDLKYPLCLKAFHSKKYNYIVQEVYARAIMFNYCSEIATHAEIPDKKRKLQYQVNFAQAIKICRDHLRNRDERCLINASGLIVNNIEPIRPDRTYRRQARFKLPMSFCYRN